MSRTELYRVDPKVDLLLERVVDVPKERVWTAWTVPEHLMKWFTPTPWKTVQCEIDLRPGGIFRTVMRSPEGQDYPHLGCYLEVVPNQKLVWTVALLPGYRPTNEITEVPSFTAIISLESSGKGTKYSALVRHKDEADCRKHEQMGFQDGWGKALDQLVTAAKTM